MLFGGIDPPSAPREGPPQAGCAGLLLVLVAAAAIRGGLLWLVLYVTRDL